MLQNCNNLMEVFVVISGEKLIPGIFFSFFFDFIFQIVANSDFFKYLIRFSYIAFNCLALLKRLNTIDLEKGVEFILRCANFDGGFGVIPGAESHSGQSNVFFFCSIKLFYQTSKTIPF